MDKDILSLIEQSYGGFSKGQKRIARYIRENFDKAAFMTASKLGKNAGVSESTVVRFATEIGYAGYPEMRKALQEMIRNRLTSVQRIEVARNVMDSKDTLASVLHADMEKIQMTIESVDKEQFDNAVQKILKARNIYIVGARTSAALSIFLGFYFNLLFANVKMLHESPISEVFEQVMRVSAEDVIIGISFPRYSKRTIKTLRLCKDIGASVIGITDTKTSPVAKIADISLLAKSDMVSFVDSLVAPLSLINALIVAVGNETNEKLNYTFEELERIWDEYEVYEKAED
ncbi:MAG: MurR/RpiR family transcriptional regulator [Clostridiales bacterium]|jgi:DNA-binding MurR/RpiR family transcriptional regulator|nr:MurR/RpiR family transcriptional regulator [Clostridiales bacterium]